MHTYPPNTIHVHSHTHAHTCTHTYTLGNACTQLHSHACTHSLVQSYKYAQAHVHEHTNAHACTHMQPTISRYICKRNTILVDYPTIWPKKKFAVQKGQIYDLTQTNESRGWGLVTVSGVWHFAQGMTCLDNGASRSMHCNLRLKKILNVAVPAAVDVNLVYSSVLY